MLDYLPQNLLVSVFLKLPIKTLVLCTSVCKSWHSLITSPAFISTHHHHQKTHHLLRQALGQFKCAGFDLDRFSLRSDSESFDEIQHLSFEFESGLFNQLYRIIGSCRGLLCLSNYRLDFDGTIIVWNPMIRKSITLPHPFRTVLRPSLHLLGFGFDSLTNDFKVVKIAYRKDKILGWAFPPDISVYSLCTSHSYWLPVDASVPPHQPSNFCNWPAQAYINDAIHWIVHNQTKNQPFIMLFDIINELFREMMLPTSLTTGSCCVDDMSLVVLRGSLSVTEFNNNVNVCRRMYTSCTIWMMKKYGVPESWTKQFVINVDVGGFGMPIGLGMNGDVLLTTTENDLVSYNPDTQQIKKLGIQDPGNLSYCGTFTGSLVMIKPLKGTSKWKRNLLLASKYSSKKVRIL